MDRDWLASVRRTLIELADKEGRIGLLYSGGLESSLLLKLLEPHRDKATVYTVRTGAEFPHMVQFTDRMLAPWDHHVITRDLMASFAELGLPSSVLPIEHTQGFAKHLDAPERTPRIVPWPLCCSKNRSVLDWELFYLHRLTTLISGQRAGDYASKNPSLNTAPPGEPDAPQIKLVHPLWDVSREDVRKAVEALGIELPDHYGEFPDSLDCSVCPASLTARRRAWMAGRYPEHLAVAQKLHADVATAVITALDADNTAKARDKQFQ
jgi:3'-phosphoadenosine 5'-phosphosulfate sulfotransferase (PAPS reductase)/FAD synthetase